MKKAAERKMLVGGQALKNLGSSRNTQDTDYLVNDKNLGQFHHENGVDFLNAAKNDFFAAVWKAEKNNKTGQASPQSLLELKAYALVQHAQNRMFQKADDCEFDIRFLVRNCGAGRLQIAQKWMTEGQAAEINAIIDGVKK